MNTDNAEERVINQNFSIFFLTEVYLYADYEGHKGQSVIPSKEWKL